MAFSQTMFIEINEDIIKDAIEKKDLPANTTKDLLIQMALCAKQGKHIVSVPCFLKSKAYCKSISELIGKSYFSALDYYNRKRSEYGQILSHLSVRGFITYEEKSDLPNNFIRIIPNKHSNFEPWVEAHVLTENLMDSSFYIYLAYYYFNVEILGGRKRRFDFCYKFYPLMGGGVTIEKVLYGEIKREQHFCLALADSDKKWDGDTNVGDTAQKMLDLMKNENPFNCKLYVMSKVREIENLIPRKFVEKFGDKTGFIDIFNYNPSFYDMKIGLSLTELFHNKVCKYWKDMFNDPALFIERNNIRQRSQSKKDYDKTVKGMEPLKKGFGSSLLSLVVGDIDYEKDLKKYNPKMQDGLYHVIPSELTVEQREEWKNIGREIFSWTCCLKAKI